MTLPAGAAPPAPSKEVTRLKREVVDPCPVTKPNRSQPPGSTFDAVFHGNGQIWVGLPEENIVLSEEGMLRID